MKVTKQEGVQRIGPCQKDQQEADKREFEAKGLDLIFQLRKELNEVKEEAGKGQWLGNSSNEGGLSSENTENCSCSSSSVDV